METRSIQAACDGQPVQQHCEVCFSQTCALTGTVLLCRQPKWYGERMRRKIQAGAGVENLRLRCPYFYDVALLLHSRERGPSLAEFAMKTFQARYKVVLSPSQCAGMTACAHFRD